MEEKYLIEANGMPTMKDIKPIEVKALDSLAIWVRFSDTTEGEVDLSHLVGKPIFKAWQNMDYFRKVHIDKETSAIAWDENIEICPDSIYFRIKGLTFEQWKIKQK